MAFKTSAQLFGDNGAAGAAVPRSLTNPPGTAAANRGVQFGEELTAEHANRPTYALALNTDDLNNRLVPFETDGLDAAYRLGAAAVPGGGRVITKDGGALETQSALAASYEDDVANAHFRANALGDAIKGSVGYDFLAEDGASTQAAAYSILDRRLLTFNNDTILTASNAAVLFKTGAAATAANTVTLTTGQWTDGATDEATDVISGVDLLEVIGGDTPGLYRITIIDDADGQYTASLEKLNGDTPTFTADDAVTVRLFRPAFQVASRYGTNEALGGTYVVGIPTASATGSALTLIPGSRQGLDSDGSQGPQYALRVQQVSRDGVASSTLTISARGTVRCAPTSLTLEEPRRLAGTGFGSPAFMADHTSLGTGYEVGMVSRGNSTSLTDYYGMVALDVQAIGTASYPSSGSASGVGIQHTGVQFQVGQVIELLTGAQAGIYVVRRAFSPATGAELQHLDGTTVSGWPTSGVVPYRRFAGVTLGRRLLQIQNPAIVGGVAQPSTAQAAMLINGPTKTGTTVDANLVLTAGTGGSGMFIRAIVESGVENFSVTTAGGLFAQRVDTGDLEASNLTVTNDALFEGDVTVEETLTITSAILVDPPVACPYEAIPLGTARPSHGNGTAHWFFGNTFGYGEDSAPPNWQFGYTSGHATSLWIPVSGSTIAEFAELTSMRTRYRTNGYTTGTMRLKLVTVSATDGAMTEQEIGTLTAHEAGFSASTFAVDPTVRVITYTGSVYLKIEPDPDAEPDGFWEFASVELAHNVDQIAL